MKCFVFEWETPCLTRHLTYAKCPKSNEKTAKFGGTRGGGGEPYWRHTIFSRFFLFKCKKPLVCYNVLNYTLLRH